MTAQGAARKRSGEDSSIFKEAKSFSSFSVRNLDKAREFYSETLGLEVDETEQGLEMHLAGGNAIFLYPKDDHSPATFTVLNFPVKDIDAAVDELADAGVKLERYDLPDLKMDKRGIAKAPGMKIAWFKDPDGNILSVIETSKR
jgi:catechol 2,3-dioxygenase-like lactoylglutathione lyase family enzyme